MSNGIECGQCLEVGLNLAGMYYSQQASCQSPHLYMPLLPAMFLYKCITEGQSDANVCDLELIELVGTWHATVN